MTAPAVCLSLALLAWLLYQEATRPDRRWRTARLAASLAAAAGLLLLQLPLRYTVTLPSKEAMGVLMTEGWDRDSLRCFMHSHPDARLFSTRPNTTDAAYVPDLRLLEKTGALHVFGHGLDEAELDALEGRAFRFHPSPLRNAVTKLYWNASVALGERLVLQGLCPASGRPVKLVLSGFGTALDSVSLPAGQAAAFQLATVPRGLGRAVYNLAVLQGGDTLEQGPVPVEVSTTPPLRLLLLSASPDFEKNFLKNWLTKQGFGFAIRTAISKDKWDQEFINREPLSLGRVTPALLGQFDIALADQKALEALSAAETAALREAVSGGGLGLLVQADSAGRPGSFYEKGFALTGRTDSLLHTLQLRFPLAAETVPLVTDAPLFIRGSDELRPLLRDREARILAASKRFGNGRVLLTTIHNSYSWQLAGQAGAYGRYWAALLQSAAPRALPERSWTAAPAFPRRDEPLRIRLGNGTRIPTVQLGAAVLSPAQDYRLPDQWSTVFWPREEGWHPVLIDGSPAGWLYVFASGNWPGVKAAEALGRTEEAARVLPDPVSGPDRAVRQEEQVPPGWFFLLVLAGAGLLWYERKRHGS